MYYIINLRNKCTQNIKTNGVIMPIATYSSAKIFYFYLFIPKVGRNLRRIQFQFVFTLQF